MTKWCIDNEAGQQPGPLAVKRGRGEQRAIEDVSSRYVKYPDSYSGFNTPDDESTLIKDDIVYTIDTEIMKQRLYEHDGYYTSHGDTFKDVCRATGLDKAQWQMYYDWVHEHFMRGETFLQRDENDQFVYADSIGFMNPFKTGSRRKPLPDNVRFPLPQGP